MCLRVIAKPPVKGLAYIFSDRLAAVNVLNSVEK